MKELWPRSSRQLSRAVACGWPCVRRARRPADPTPGRRGDGVVTQQGHPDRERRCQHLANDLRPLLSYLGIKDRAQANSLIADAKIARTRAHVSWWQQPEFRDLLGELRRYFEYEAVAIAIRTFTIRYLPGPLQFPEYATALTGPLDEELGSTEQGRARPAGCAVTQSCPGWDHLSTTPFWTSQCSCAPPVARPCSAPSSPNCTASPTEAGCRSACCLSSWTAHRQQCRLRPAVPR